MRFLFFNFFRLFYVCVCTSVCLYTMYVPGAQGGQKRAQDPPELWMAVSKHVVAGNQACVL